MLLSDTNIQRRMPTSEKRADQVKTFVRVLGERHPDLKFVHARETVLEATDIVESGTVKVFLSYKMAKGYIAKKFTEQLANYAANKLEFYLAGLPGGVPFGVPWKDDLVRALQSSHWFIMLVPDPHHEMGWLLYEAGRFHERMKPLIHRLICIHSPKVQVPSQLAELQAVSADKDNLVKFFQQLFWHEVVPGMEPINRHLALEAIESFAEQVEELMKPEIGEERHLIPYLDLEIADLENFQNVEDLRDAQITRTYWISDVFGAGAEDRQTLGNLVDHAAAHFKARVGQVSDRSAWLQELSDTIRHVRDNRPCWPLQCLFSGVSADKDFHPYVHSWHPFDVNGQGRGGVFHISFIEEIPPYMVGIPKDLEALLTGLRLAFRFHYEICNQYLGDFPIRRLETPEDIEEVQRVLERMETEAQLRGTLDPRTTLQFFSGEKHKSEHDDIKEMFEEWFNVFRTRDQSGRMDKAFKEKNAVELLGCFSELHSRNLNFLRIVFRRFSELVSERLEKDLFLPPAQQPSAADGASAAAGASQDQPL